MSMISMVVFFDGTTYVHGRQKGKDKCLNECNHDFNKVQKQCKQGNYRRNSETLEYEYQAKKT